MPIICEAMIALALTEPDRQWMERQLVELMRDADGSVRSIAALAVGHLARVHGQIDLEEVMPVLQELLGDGEAAGNTANALDDIGTFVHYGKADDPTMRVVDTTDMDDEDADLGPKHPSFAAHFRGPIYDDPTDDFAPFGNDEGADLLDEWVDRVGELDSGSTLTQIAPEWFEDAPLLPAEPERGRRRPERHHHRRGVHAAPIDRSDRRAGPCPRAASAGHPETAPTGSNRRPSRCAPTCWHSASPTSKSRLAPERLCRSFGPAKLAEP